MKPASQSRQMVLPILSCSHLIHLPIIQQSKYIIDIEKQISVDIKEEYFFILFIMCDADVKSDIYKYWSRDVLCNPTYGECDFVNHACICHEGFTHDLQYLRQRRCHLPNLYFPIMFGVQIALSLLLLPYIYLRCRETKAMARLSLQLNLISCIVYIFFCIFNFSYWFVINPLIILTFYLIVGLLSVIKYIEIFSFISPLAAAAMKPIAPIKKMLFIVFLLYKVVEIIPLLIQSIKYGDPNDPNNDSAWSIYIMIYTLIVCIEAVSTVLILSIYAKKMLNVIDDLSSDREDSTGNSSKISANYLNKMRRMVFRVVIIFPSVAVVLFFSPVMYLTTGYIPFSYIFSSLAIFSVPPIILVSTMYASSSTRIASISQSSPTKTSSKRFNDKVISNDQHLKYTLNVTDPERQSAVQTQ